MKKKKCGQPTKYKKEFVEQVYKLTAGGFIDKQIAEFFKISEATLNTWKLKYPDFVEGLLKGKDDFDTLDVKNSLLKRARGFEYVETTKEISPWADLETGLSRLHITKEVTKTVPPDTAACFIWLKNRDPEKWRDKHEMEVGGTITHDLSDRLEKAIEATENAIRGKGSKRSR